MATVSVIYDKETDDYIVPLGNDVCDEVGWQVGDTIKWQDTGDGSYTLTKITKNDDTKLEPGKDPAGSLED